jgi:hypothetical protein
MCIARHEGTETRIVGLLGQVRNSKTTVDLAFKLLQKERQRKSSSLTFASPANNCFELKYLSFRFGSRVLRSSRRRAWVPKEVIISSTLGFSQARSPAWVCYRQRTLRAGA